MRSPIFFLAPPLCLTSSSEFCANQFILFPLSTILAMIPTVLDVCLRSQDSFPLTNAKYSPQTVQLLDPRFLICIGVALRNKHSPSWLCTSLRCGFCRRACCAPECPAYEVFLPLLVDVFLSRFVDFWKTPTISVIVYKRAVYTFAHVPTIVSRFSEALPRVHSEPKRPRN